MSNLKNIRKALALSQTDLAIYLGISRSLLSKIEAGNKTISTAALQKITQLHQFAQQANTRLVSTEVEKQQSELNSFMQHKTVENIRLKKELAQMQTQYNTALQTLQLLRQIKNNLPATAIKDVLWCNALEATTIEKLKTCGLVKQKMLELRIA